LTRKRLSLFGSTGSIGRRTLDVARDYPDDFAIVALSAGRNTRLLHEQIREFKPQAAAIAEPSLAAEAEAIARDTGVPVYCGAEGLLRLAREFAGDMAVMATVGFAGLFPSLAALESGADLALANKEVLVTAGDLVTARAKELGRQILPIDSEHNAIFQCLDGMRAEGVRRLILTASGGPFRRATVSQLAQVTREQALAHPTWEMGQKITIDSSTLMNKGFEAIEAHHLFCVPMEQIDVVIHPQSTVHSMVEFIDGSILAQLGRTDMYLPIQNILFHPQRRANSLAPLDFTALRVLEFEPPDLERFPCLTLAYDASRVGGTMPAVLNAANEVAVARFLHNEIRYLDIPALIRAVLDEHQNTPNPSLDDIRLADEWARQRARNHGI